VLLGSVTPAGVARAARIADGINPIVVSEEVLRELISALNAAADEQGRDPADLTVVARANVPITVDPIGEGRPFLGGSPRQIADDLARLDGAGVDQVLFSNAVAKDIDQEVRLLEELQRIVSR
jgi:alkanesulfonate monooxygenase SsuD/methylene tetrahydromethanopterin reductase-like flavin-dependent oxidoreductase (luciferase family)